MIVPKKLKILSSQFYGNKRETIGFKTDFFGNLCFNEAAIKYFTLLKEAPFYVYIARDEEDDSFYLQFVDLFKNNSLNREEIPFELKVTKNKVYIDKSNPITQEFWNGKNSVGCYLRPSDFVSDGIVWFKVFRY